MEVRGADIDVAGAGTNKWQDCLGGWFAKCGPETQYLYPLTSNLLEMHTLELYPRPPESDSGWNPAVPVLLSLIRPWLPANV